MAQDLCEILNLLNANYPMTFDDISVIRDFVGCVCAVRAGGEKYAVKLSRASHAGRAKQSAEIMSYLARAGYPVPAIVPTAGGKPWFSVQTPEGDRIGVLFEFIEGPEPKAAKDAAAIGHQAGELHRLMREYPGKLIRYDRPYFIDSYIRMLREMGYPESRMELYAEYGDTLWKRVEHLPRGFCHGDLHTGNMIRAASGDVYLLDFDLASFSFPVFDAVTVCDVTDYFRYSDRNFDRVTRAIERFCKGYAHYRSFSDAEVAAIYDFIAIRHFQLQAQIVECFGLHCNDMAFPDRQYEWLMRWREQCGR